MRERSFHHGVEEREQQQQDEQEEEEQQQHEEEQEEQDQKRERSLELAKLDAERLRMEASIAEAQRRADTAA
eukprot:SAG11_NODE_18517_length_488_cov_9.290488_1_plen_71_part_01